MLGACSPAKETPPPTPKVEAKAPAGTPAEPAKPAPAAQTPAGEKKPEASAPTPSQPPATAPAASGGIGFSGIVKFDGPRPKRTVIKMNADPKCEAIHGGKNVGSESEIVSAEGGVKNVFVYVKDGPIKRGGYSAPQAAELKQEGCLYSPHVQGVLVEQPFNIVNADSLLHNVHALAKVNPEFNFGQPAPGTKDRVFHKVEMPMKIKCDVHPWMGAYVFVMDHPYFAVTDEKGAFAIANLPAGQYTLTAWHEVYGEAEAKVAGGATDVSFTFKAK